MMHSDIKHYKIANVTNGLYKYFVSPPFWAHENCKTNSWIIFRSAWRDEKYLFWPIEISVIL